jgi:hypothetical protein
MRQHGRLKMLNCEPELLARYLSHKSNSCIPIIDSPGNFDTSSFEGLRECIVASQKEYWKCVSSEEITKTPPIEWHPYINTDKLISKDNRTLILGTFPPPSYLHNKFPFLSRGKFLKGIDIDNPPVLDFFYGNRGFLWDILKIRMNKSEVDNFLGKETVVSDMILGLQRNSLTKGRAADENLENIIPNWFIVDEIIYGEHDIENIVFTSKTWEVTDGEGKGRRPSQFQAKKIELRKKRSAISLFFRCVELLGEPFKLKLPSHDKPTEFLPENIEFIKTNFYDEFCVEIEFANNRKYTLNIGDSPSGNAFNPFESKTFKRWIKWKYGEKGLKALNDNPRNTINDPIKRKRKSPIQEQLGCDEDICEWYLRDLYTFFIGREFSKLYEIFSQEVESHIS